MSVFSRLVTQFFSVVIGGIGAIHSFLDPLPVDDHRSGDPHEHIVLIERGIAHTVVHE